MFLVILDSNPASRAALLGRVQEAIRQAEVRKLEPVEVDLPRLESFDASQAVGCIIGPGYFSEIDQVVEQVRVNLSSCPLGLAIESEVYATDAVALRKRLNLHVMALGDLAQLVGFVIECDRQVSAQGSVHKNRGVVAISQMKGGVGCTTLTTALAACWAKHGLTVAAIDLDDVNPQLTEWGRVGLAQRTITSEFLRQGEVPSHRINEMLHPVEGFEGRFVVVGQPERYNESFHYKADVLEGAPSSSEFITSLISCLQGEFDVVIIDTSRSWGIATFAALPLCQHVLCVTDDDGMSVRRTLDGLLRLKREANDSEEFDMSRWSLLLNAYTGRLISPRDVASEIRDMDLFPPESNLYTVPFSERGRQWGAPGQTLYEMADEKTRFVVRKIAYSLIPFRFEQTENALVAKIIKKLQAITKTG